MANEIDFKNIIRDIDAKAETKGSINDARFGDNWRETMGTKIGMQDLIKIAWVQGRRAILLEKALRDALK